MAEFEAQGAKLYVPRGDRDYAIHVGLRMLALRHLVEERGGLYAAVPSERPLLAYYANAIAHHRQIMIDKLWRISCRPFSASSPTVCRPRRRR